MMMTGDRTLFVWLIGGELTVHFIVKIVRGDFLCFVPIEGPFGYFLSFIWHLMTKIIGDFRLVSPAKRICEAQRMNKQH